ncbi:DUF503 domain-containing protein [Bdellovibrionota bacterium]
MFVGIARISLMLADNTSLKGKRQVINKIRDRLQHRFNVAVAEIEDQDNHQRATLGFVTVSSDHALVDSSLRKMLNYINDMHLGLLADEDMQIEKFELGSFENMMNEKG